jgi:hypothetical protein
LLVFGPKRGLPIFISRRSKFDAIATVASEQAAIEVLAVAHDPRDTNSKLRGQPCEPRNIPNGMHPPPRTFTHSCFNT